MLTKAKCGIAKTPKSQRWAEPTGGKRRPSAHVVAHNATVFTTKGVMERVSITAGGRARGLGIEVEMMSHGMYQQKNIPMVVLQHATNKFGYVKARRVIER